MNIPSKLQGSTRHPSKPPPATRNTRGSWLRQILPLPCALVALASGPAVAGAVETVAIRADDFLNSIGANSAISRRGETLSNTITAARFLGLRWLRVGYESGIPVADLIKLHEETGVRFSYGLMSGGTNLARLLDGARQLAEAGALIALEGNNEPNNWGVTYEGQKGGRTNSWLPVAKLQRDLYRAVKFDSVLKDYPVWSPSENGAQTDNVGLQFLTIPAGAGTLMPDGTRYADYANCHNYMTHPSWAGLHDNQTWIAADPGPACRVDGLYGNHGRTWRRRYAGYSEQELLTLPRVTTETGITIGEPINEQIQALLYLSVYLDQFKRGWKHTAIYLLRDRTDEGGNQTFGFYKPNYTPRLAATYLHHLTTILADKPSAKPVGKLDYSIPSQPATVHDLLLQKSDGKFELAVWNERSSGGSDKVTVKLGRPAATATLFDPATSDSPVRSLSSVNSITLTLSNHPVIVEISGPLPARSAVDSPIQMAGTTGDVQWEKRVLTDKYYCDGINCGDFNRDGRMDIVAGPFWYQGPDFKTAHEIYSAKEFPKPPSPTDSLYSFVHDFNGDGWTDVLVIGRVHLHQAFWYENPQGKPVHWKKHFVHERVQAESPAFADIDQDGRPEIICIWLKQWGLVKPDWNAPTNPWTFQPIIRDGDWTHFYHGTGVGDVNGDGRPDLLLNEGWWERPVGGSPSGDWIAHRLKFAPKGGAQMFADDVDGDGDNDIITSLDAHGWGLAWFEQVKEGGRIEFREHKIMGDRSEELKFGAAFSQPHALDLADIDGDGLKDIIVGKRMWAHGPTGDIEPGAAPVLYWFQLTRDRSGEIRYVPHLIDEQSGVGCQVVASDVTGDGRADILTVSKLGAFVFISRNGVR